MNLENVIVCAICLVAIAVVGYFMYTKVTTQNEEMLKLSKRCDSIEMMFARPPPPDDLQAMYRGRAGQPVPARDRRLTVHEHEGRPRSPPCESAMCDLEPLRIDTNEDELNHIVDAELNKVFGEGKASSKKSASPKSSSSKKKD